MTSSRTKIYVCSFSNNVGIGASETVKKIGLAEPETIEREGHLGGFSFRFIEAVRTLKQVFRRCWVRLFVVIRLKSSV